MHTDKQRLNWIESRAKGYKGRGAGAVRWYMNSSGDLNWALFTDGSRDFSARKAIDKAMKYYKTRPRTKPLTKPLILF